MVGWKSEIISADTEDEGGGLGLNLFCFQEGPNFHKQTGKWWVVGKRFLGRLAHAGHSRRFGGCFLR